MTTSKSSLPSAWRSYTIALFLLTYFGYCGFAGEPFFWFLDSDKWSAGGPGGRSRFHK